MRENILKSLYLLMNSLKQFQSFNKDSTSSLALFLPSRYLPNLSRRVWIYGQLRGGSLILRTAVCSALIPKNPMEKTQDEMRPQKFLGIFENAQKAERTVIGRQFPFQPLLFITNNVMEEYISSL